MNTPATFNKKRMFITIKKFIITKSFGGLILFISALIALFLANSQYSTIYNNFLTTQFIAGVSDIALSMDIKTWVNDGLMSIFFLLVGLEIKREALIGELSSLKLALFPIMGALGGMIFPALIYVGFNFQEHTHAFGIPMATDIAFALAILLVLGSRISISLKLFLVTLAVTDDIGSVMVIALFYTQSINFTGLLLAIATIILLIFIARIGIKSLFLYLILGVFMWNFFHLSGIHTSISGIILAFCIPITASISTKDFVRRLRFRLNYFEKLEEIKREKILSQKQIGVLDIIGNAYDSVQSPLIRLEHNILPISTFLVMPIFAFCNAGVNISEVTLSLLHPVSLGIIFGLCVGKPLGIFLFVYATHTFNIAKKPDSLTWVDIFGVSILGGIGFTMSIFISIMAFEDSQLVNLAKLSIIIASFFSAILGTIWLLYYKKPIA